MLKPFHCFVGFGALVGVVGLAQLPQAIAQTNRPPQPNEGRGVAHGSVFRRGQNVNTSLTVDRGRFSYTLAQPPGTRNQVRYQGAVVRQNNTGNNPNSFTLDGRVQTFDSSASNRILNNTTGTCRIEVFDARVISSTCRSASPDSVTQFLGLEQF